jgi:hypothetical protein
MDPNNYFMNMAYFNPAAAAQQQQPNMFMGLPPPPQQNVTAATNNNTNNSKSAPAKKGRASKKSKLSDAEKVKKRLDANRIAARESRKRKKVLVEELQRSVSTSSMLCFACIYDPFGARCCLEAGRPTCNSEVILIIFTHILCCACYVFTKKNTSCTDRSSSFQGPMVN